MFLDRLGSKMPEVRKSNDFKDVIVFLDKVRQEKKELKVIHVLIDRAGAMYKGKILVWSLISYCNSAVRIFHLLEPLKEHMVR